MPAPTQSNTTTTTPTRMLTAETGGVNPTLLLAMRFVETFTDIIL
jgi:hypothetical protein